MAIKKPLTELPSDKKIIKPIMPAKSKTTAIVLLAIIVTLIVIGGAAYAVQIRLNQYHDQVVQQLQQQVDNMSNQVSKMRLAQVQQKKPGAMIEVKKFHLNFVLPSGYNSYVDNSEQIFGSAEKNIQYNVAQAGNDSKTNLQYIVVDIYNGIVTEYDYCHSKNNVCVGDPENPSDYQAKFNAWQNNKKIVDQNNFSYEPRMINGVKYLVAKGVTGTGSLWYYTYSNNSLNSQRISVEVYQPAGAADAAADELISQLQINFPGQNDSAVLLKQLFANRDKKTIEDIMLTFNQETDNYIRGGVSYYDAETVKASGYIMGGYFLAAKVDGNWKIVIDGNGSISCKLVNGYGFPNTMISDCAKP
jgi:hypothetical protein